jgi:hypothetical protein
MKNLESEFVSYNLALRMKALRFDEPCLAAFHTASNRLITEFEIMNTPSHCIGISAPTFQSAFFWLIPQINDEFKVCLDEDGWYIYNLENKIFRGDEAVEKLIEIVEQKQIKK